MLINASRSRDILECIASLSSDEVATPPAVANQVLDLLPVEVWSNKDLKWLDPACKTGVFLREAARRLMEGLKDSIPDEAKRRKHIFTNMLHGYALTELTAQMSRRSLYYNKDASNKGLSVVPFKNEEGNIHFSSQDHQYDGSGQCAICGASEQVFGAPGNRERHAYDFIHNAKENPMKFDVIVGNPPYQIEDGGFGVSARPIYQLFVNQAFRLRPRYTAMIIPSRWFAGGKGLDAFRAAMLESRSFRALIDYPDAGELFPGVQIKGGICYFLWDSTYDGPCEVVTIQSGEEGQRAHRYLGEFGDIFVRFNEALPILKKVRDVTDLYLDRFVSSRKPFGLPTNFTGFTEHKGSNSIPLFTNDGPKWIDRTIVVSRPGLIDKWKVLTAKAGPGNDEYPHRILGQTVIAGPPSACTETFLVVDYCDSEEQANNLKSYLATKFARFLVALRKNTQDVIADRFSFVPALDMGEHWTDKKLYELFGISKAEQDFIDSIVRPWEE
jgi:site-specific DNA-methyltransferase (adenine-specific)